MPWRKARDVKEITADPAFHFQIGSMIGAMQMAGYVLVLHEDEKVQEVGRRLYEASGWFFEPGGELPVPASEQQTKVLPPARASGS